MIKTIVSLLVKLALLSLLLANMGCALAAGAAIGGAAGTLLSGVSPSKGIDLDAGGIAVKDQQEANAMVERMRADRRRQYEESQSAPARPDTAAP
jgi:hypothetical protein